jgi:nicotinamidase-related amidase
VAQTAKLIHGCQVLQVPVFYTEQYPRGLGATESALLELLGGAIRAEKTAFSAGEEPALLEALERSQRDQVIIAGMETHVCVLQTAFDLIAGGFQPFVITDAVCSRRDLDRDVALQRMAREGVVVATVESALFEMTQTSGTGVFREIARLVK